MGGYCLWNTRERICWIAGTRGKKMNIGNFWVEKSGGKGGFMLVCETRDEYKFDKQMKRFAG